MIFEASIGAEDAVRQIFLQLYAGLNAEIVAVSNTWLQKDRDFMTSLGGDPDEGLIVLEEIAPENFYPHHSPSLIEAPVGNYPNVSVFANSANSVSAELEFDQVRLGGYRIKVVVEVMCRSLTNEREASSRLLRTTDAVHNVIVRDPTFGGTFPGPVLPLSAQFSDVFVRLEETSHGAPWYWQGARLEYTVPRTSIH